MLLFSPEKIINIQEILNVKHTIWIITGSWFSLSLTALSSHITRLETGFCCCVWCGLLTCAKTELSWDMLPAPKQANCKLMFSGKSLAFQKCHLFGNMLVLAEWDGVFLTLFKGSLEIFEYQQILEAQIFTVWSPVLCPAPHLHFFY